MASGRIVQTNREKDVSDEYRVALVVTPQTGDETLREIGAIGFLLMEIIQEAWGLSGRVSVEKHSNGVRVIAIPEMLKGTTRTLNGVIRYGVSSRVRCESRENKRNPRSLATHIKLSGGSASSLFV